VVIVLRKIYKIQFSKQKMKEIMKLVGEILELRGRSFQEIEFSSIPSLVDAAKMMSTNLNRDVNISGNSSPKSKKF
jgi:hypothetical protein